VRAVPITEPDVSHMIGLVVPHSEPAMPIVQALVAEGHALAALEL
jgi:hypothetical protein